MKPILIDEINCEFTSQGEFIVKVDGTTYIAWKLAKPLNYEDEYATQKDRNKMAKLVKEGKAIAVQFFEDLTEDEKIQKVKEELKDEK